MWECGNMAALREKTEKEDRDTAETVFIPAPGIWLTIVTHGYTGKNQKGRSQDV